MKSKDLYNRFLDLIGSIACQPLLDYFFSLFLQVIVCFEVTNINNPL